MIFSFTFAAVVMSSNLGMNAAVLRLTAGVSIRPYQVPRKEERWALTSHIVDHIAMVCLYALVAAMAGSLGKVAIAQH